MLTIEELLTVEELRHQDLNNQDQCNHKLVKLKFR